MNDGKWIVAEGLGSWSVSEGEMAQSDTLIVRINRWLSIKRQGRWSGIEVEVAGFDHGVLNLRFVAAIHALAERNDLFFSVLPEAGFSEDELKSWPIFDEMREDPRFKDFLDKNQAGAKQQEESVEEPQALPRPTQG